MCMDVFGGCGLSCMHIAVFVVWVVVRVVGHAYMLLKTHSLTPG